MKAAFKGLERGKQVKGNEGMKGMKSYAIFTFISSISFIPNLFCPAAEVDGLCRADRLSGTNVAP